jgi:putative exporter of polyketide antibiotics
MDDGKILQYCSIDKKGKKSLGEMEQDFLQALQVGRISIFLSFLCVLLSQMHNDCTKNRCDEVYFCALCRHFIMRGKL